MLTLIYDKYLKNLWHIDKRFLKFAPGCVQR